MSDPGQLFEEVVTHTGLASWIGPGAVRRALQSIGVESPGAARADDYRRALPQLKARMALYLPAGDLDRRVREIEALVNK